MEVTAGQGSSLGHRFEHLAEVLQRVKRSERLGVCLDTCHLYAAGYDIASERGYDETWAPSSGSSARARSGPSISTTPRWAWAAACDRHAPVGKGHLGRETFRRIVGDTRFAGIPLISRRRGARRVEGELRLLRRLRKGP
jgi:deoxyribonuclease-4